MLTKVCVIAIALLLLTVPRRSFASDLLGNRVQAAPSSLKTSISEWLVGSAGTKPSLLRQPMTDVRATGWFMLSGGVVLSGAGGWLMHMNNRADSGPSTPGMVLVGAGLTAALAGTLLLLSTVRNPTLAPRPFSPLAPRESAAGIDPKRGSDLAFHLPLAFGHF